MTTALTLTGRPTARGRVDPLEHARDREVDVVHRLERRVVERVEADVDAVEPGVPQRLRLAREERGVRRQRDVEPVDRREPLDEALELLPEQRLATGQPDLLDAERGEGPGDALELLEREELLAVHEAVVVPEHRLRHAVRAAEVAAVGDRDPKVADRAPQGVERVHAHRVRDTGAAGSPRARVSRGAGAGIQAHPYEGADVDEDRIEGKAKQVEGEVQEGWGEAKDKARDLWDDVKDKAEDVKDDVQDSLDGDDEDDLVKRGNETA